MTTGDSGGNEPFETTWDPEVTEMSSYETTRPRVWLAGANGSAHEPTDRPTVRDNRMRTWEPGSDGRYHSADGWHHVTWTELHARFDLVEVVAVPAPALAAAA
jgi:hypothetical protein